MNKIIFLLSNFFINNIISQKFLFNQYENYEYNYDFQNVFFNDEEELKNIFFSKKYFNNKFYDEKSHNYHTFAWLKIAKKIGGAKNISLSKKHIINWNNKKYKIYTYVWSCDYIAQRLINLIFNYDFYAISANQVEKKTLKAIIINHYHILKLQFNLLSNKNEQSLIITKAILLMKLILNISTEKIFEQIIKQLNSHINSDGFHQSLNPSMHAEYINELHEIKNMCLFFKIKAPEEINFQINNMTSVLKNLFHKDNTIALFNGSNNFYNSSFIKINNLVKDLKTKNLSKINNGIAISDFNKLKVFFDVTKPTSKLLSKDLHSGTLSFEMSYDNEKIFTNCGSVEKRIGKKPEYLRFSAAHSTIIVNNTNISELVEKKSYKRIPAFLSLKYNETDKDIIWEGSHDGYKENFNAIVKRKLTIFKKIPKIIGEDIIISTKKTTKSKSLDIRFHLTPNCKCLITNDLKSILIRTKLNQSWIFSSENKLSLEDSIYIGNGKISDESKQIVISDSCLEPKKTLVWTITKIK